MNALVLASCTTVLAAAAGSVSHPSVDALAMDDACSASGCALGALQVQQAAHRGLEENTASATASATKEETINDCKGVLSYYWPKVATLAREVVRRLGTFGIDADGLTAARHFAHQAGYWASILDFDPREGSRWADEAADYLGTVVQSDTVGMPKPPDFFRAKPNDPSRHGDVQSMRWFGSKMCEIAWWATELSNGRWQEGEVCWDNVPFPGYEYTADLSRDPDFYDHPEYLECQQFPLDEIFYDAICPGEGSGVPARGREWVASCNARLGPDVLYDGFPETGTVNFDMVHPLDAIKPQLEIEEALRLQFANHD